MKFVYTVTNRRFSILRGIFTVVFGAALLIWPMDFPQLIVKIIAAFSIVAGIFTAINYSKVKRSGLSSVTCNLYALNALLYLVFGALLFIFPQFFIGILTFFLGAILLIIGAGQLLNLIFSSKHAHVPALLYVIATALLISGVTLFFNPFTESRYLMIFFGAIMVVYGLSEFISAWRLKNVKFNEKGEFVEYEEVVPPSGIEPLP